MADHTEVIQQRMEETRSNLADKLAALEDQVSDTVQTTTEAVSETVETVKETVDKASEAVENVTDTVKETVESLGDTFNLWTQADRHPWLVFGGSVVVGYLGAQLFGGSTRETEEEEESWAPSPPERWEPAPAASFQTGNGRQQAEEPPAPRREAPPPKEEKSWFWDQAGRLKGLAIGVLMGVIRDVTKSADAPGPIGERVADEVNHLTENLGGDPIQGQVMPASSKGNG